VRHDGIALCLVAVLFKAAGRGTEKDIVTTHTLAPVDKPYTLHEYPTSDCNNNRQDKSTWGIC
jgi:hypothetical protein